MERKKVKNIFSIVFFRSLGLVLFLVLLFLLDMVTPMIDYALLDNIVIFLNENVDLIVYMSVIFLFGELFMIQSTPLNLPAPLLNAAGSLLLVTFLLNMLELVDSFTGKHFFSIFKELSFIIYALVFTVVLVGGYISIFVREVEN